MWRLLLGTVLLYTAGGWFFGSASPGDAWRYAVGMAFALAGAVVGAYLSRRFETILREYTRSHP